VRINVYNKDLNITGVTNSYVDNQRIHRYCQAVHAEVAMDWQLKEFKVPGILRPTVPYLSCLYRFFTLKDYLDHANAILLRYIS
jgi:hypothetical protein